VSEKLESSDESLAALAAAGDSSAFDNLVTRYQDRVYRLLWRLTGNEADALDVLQDTFLQAFRHLASFRGDARFGTWLYRIASNSALMHLRARSRRPSESLEEFLPRFDSAGVHRQTPDELKVVVHVEEMLDRDLLTARVQEAVGRLPEVYRVAFVLRDLEEMSTSDVAEVLDVEPATVRQRVHRARLMLRGFLSDLAGVKP
jgi:RNA polymerase sigma-70 factor (ECF subfamily)